MRHQKRGRKLSRTYTHRKALMCNLATALLEHHRIVTGHAKALELRRVVERLITHAKKGDLSSRREVARTIKAPAILQKLFSEIAPKFQERNGGYTRVLKKGFRPGDGAPVSIIELVGLAKKEKEAVLADAVATTDDKASKVAKEPSAETKPKKAAKKKADKGEVPAKA
ncbi:MAG: 50S ribosomal protein L17 [Fibrobacterota bacterium]